jgi:hypothetical protein
MSLEDTLKGMMGREVRCASEDGELALRGVFAGAGFESSPFGSGRTGKATLELVGVTVDVGEAGLHGDQRGSSAGLIEGWMGGIGFSLRIPRKDCRCAVCGAVIKAWTGLARDIPKDEYHRKTILHWNDFSRPFGDTLRVAHPACLHGIRNEREKWPSGLSFCEIPQSEEYVRQHAAIKKLVERGVSKKDAFMQTMWNNGEEPRIVEELIDGKAYRPRTGDVVVYMTPTNVVHGTVNYVSSMRSLVVLTDGTSEFSVSGGDREGLKLISRGGEFINAEYRW